MEMEGIYRCQAFNRGDFLLLSQCVRPCLVDRWQMVEEGDFSGKSSEFIVFMQISSAALPDFYVCRVSSIREFMTYTFGILSCRTSDYTIRTTTV